MHVLRGPDIFQGGLAGQQEQEQLFCCLDPNSLYVLCASWGGQPLQDMVLEWMKCVTTRNEGQGRTTRVVHSAEWRHFQCHLEKKALPVCVMGTKNPSTGEGEETFQAEISAV